ncbi:MAG: FtsX-like permease family protein [Anaerolineaceae bacterium]|nr:FtsX-like permease family protein [Anaerolineaceae bacterium]
MKFRVLLRVGWRYLSRHAWQSALMVLGIALGVAVVVAIDLANASAGRAFELSTEALTGKATHQITGGPQGLDEQVYVDLKRGGWSEPAAPVLSEYISSDVLGGVPIQLLGIDPFADAPFRDFLGEQGGAPLAELTAFLTRPGAVLLARSTAERYGLQAGQAFDITVNGRNKTVFVAGLLEAEDDLSRRALEGVLLADIATAQELTGRMGWLSRVDIILDAERPELAGQLEALLPQGALLVKAEARSSAVERMTEAFRLNLSALSLLALVVGLFLIYNTMTFSVVQRRGLFGTLRCLGVTRREIFAMVLAEAALVGVLGVVLGIGLGIALGKSTVGMVSQTINDLYFTTTVRDTGVPVESLVKGALVGLLATVLTAALPALEAASIPPRAALLRSGLESKARKSSGWAAAGGLAVLGAALLVFQIPSISLVVGFGGTLLTVLGAALLSSAAVVALVWLLAPLTRRLFGLEGRLAPRNLLNSLSRTSVAVTALMVAVAVTIGVGIMIDGFRNTVVLWMEQTLQSDIYLSAPTFTATTPSSPIDAGILARLEAWPGVRRVDLTRSTTVMARQGQVNLTAVRNPDVGQERAFVTLEGSQDDVWEAMGAGGVLVSEPLAYRLGIEAPGTEIELETPAGWQGFRVIGVYYDYASSEGLILMGMDVYRRLWADEAVTAVGLRLEPGQDADAVTRDMQDGLGNGQELLIRPNKNLRADVLEVFDRTFAITVALRVLATVVAFIGVLSALLLLQLEKQREIGILRALGLTGGQLRKMVLVETGMMGLMAGLLAVPVGYALAMILIYVINRRSFGWTLQASVSIEALAQGVLVALVAALLAGIYPALRMSRMAAAEAIRYE